MNRKLIKQLRRDYPIGCRVVLDQMNDPYTHIPAGTQGTCKGVDGIGSIMVDWDCGSTLSIVYDAGDRCHRIATESEIVTTIEWLWRREKEHSRCPRCGRPETDSNRLLALSRRADVTICETCGNWEGMEDAGMSERKPLCQWAILQDHIAKINTGSKEQ